MHCSRDLIKVELKRTRALQPMPAEDQIHISCPFCQKLSKSKQCLFQDVDKTKTIKVYTDSPNNSAMLEIADCCAPTEITALNNLNLRISINKISKKGDVSKAGLRIEYPIMRVEDQEEMNLDD